MKRVLALLALIFGALAVTEIVMRPTSADRIALGGLYTGLAALAGVFAWLAPRLVSRAGSLRHAIGMIVLTGSGTAAVAILLSALFMFTSAHDLHLLLIIVGLAAGLGAVVAIAVSRPLAADLGRLGNAARRVADGDLEVQTGIDRPDELGAAARTFDAMVSRLAAADRERAQAEAERRALLAAIGHDLRTPLSALRAAVEALEDGVVDDPKRTFVGMHHDIEALSHLVDDLFLLAQIEAGRYEPQRFRFDLAELADEAVEAMTPVARRHEVTLRLHTEGRVEAVGDPRDVGRAVRNVVDNAIRHAPPGTEVRVEVATGVGALVRVVDEGPGFPSGFRERAFDRFSRADPARGRETGGAGLGLAIAKGVVDALGGRIWIEDGPGGRVAFALPSERAPTPIG